METDTKTDATDAKANDNTELDWVDKQLQKPANPKPDPPAPAQEAVGGSLPVDDGKASKGKKKRKTNDAQLKHLERIRSIPRKPRSQKDHETFLRLAEAHGINVPSHLRVWPIGGPAPAQEKKVTFAQPDSDGDDLVQTPVTDMLKAMIRKEAAMMRIMATRRKRGTETPPDDEQQEEADDGDIGSSDEVAQTRPVQQEKEKEKEKVKEKEKDKENVKETAPKPIARGWQTQNRVNWI